MNCSVIVYGQDNINDKKNESQINDGNVIVLVAINGIINQSNAAIPLEGKDMNIHLYVINVSNSYVFLKTDYEVKIEYYIYKDDLMIKRGIKTIKSSFQPNGYTYLILNPTCEMQKKENKTTWTVQDDSFVAEEITVENEDFVKARLEIKYCKVKYFIIEEIPTLNAIKYDDLYR